MKSKFIFTPIKIKFLISFLSNITKSLKYKKKTKLSNFHISLNKTEKLDFNFIKTLTCFKNF